VTPNDDAYRLLSEYAAGNLSKAEEAQLARAALDDPAVFEALVEEEQLREALEDTVFRRHIKTRLRELGVEKEPYFARLWQFIISPKGILTTVGALASVAIFVLAQIGVFRNTPVLIQVNLGSSSEPATTATVLSQPVPADASLSKEVQSLPIPHDTHAVLQLDRTGRHPEYAIGQPQRIGFRVDQNASAVLLEERPDGTIYRLFPNRFQESPDVTGGQTILVPPEGQGNLEVQAPAGPRVLRLILFPYGSNPLQGDAAGDKLRNKAKEVRLVYEVKEKP
jgi:hypothetical protein